jgi:alkanesulfonate monooxygenase SsuD/methylene tetrahydromethanopterin reductase-like flavin-dependent oxidoreductase (luciferase family)
MSSPPATGLQFGLFNLMTRPSPHVSPGEVFGHMKAMVQIADQGGFDIAWMTEHHLSNYCISTSPLTMTAHMAGFTERIKLGPAVVVLPFYEPIRLIEDIFLVDQLLEGRFVLGIGTGYQPREFTRFGVDINDRVRRGLEIWDSLWEAQHHNHLDMAIEPLQRPIPTFAVGSDPVFRRRIIERGATPMFTPGLLPGTAIGLARQQLDETCAELGVSNDGSFAVQRYVFVTESAAEARHAAEQIQHHGRLAANIRRIEPEIDGAFLGTPSYAGEPSVDDILANSMIGPAEKVAEQIIEEARLYDISHLSVFMQFAAMPYAATLRSLDRFVEDVMPVVAWEFS